MKSLAAEFGALALVHFLAVVSPGPDFAFTVSQSVTRGRRIAIYTALGIGAGISVHVIYTVLGVGALMHGSVDVMAAARVLGAAYIVYLASRLLRSRPGAAELAEAPVVPPASHQSARQAFVKGFFTNATNPKATLFFLAIFTTLVSGSTPWPVQMLYGLWMCLVTAVWFIMVGIFFSNARVRSVFLRLGHWFEKAMGVLLLVFAIRLIVEMF